MTDDIAAERLRRRVQRLAHGFGNLFVDLFHYIALFAIGAATVWSAMLALPTWMFDESQITAPAGIAKSTARQSTNRVRSISDV